jgi:hypothetical protein
MTLFKTRPVVRVLLGRELIAGEHESVTLELACRRPVPVDRVIVRLIGEVAWTYSGHYRGRRQSARFFEAEQILVASPREFEAGAHRLTASFELGPDCPGSWEGICLSVEYRVLVDVEIPWWPDLHREYAVPLIARSGEPGARERDGDRDRARVWASHPAGPAGKQPYLEVALATTVLRADGELRGSAAMGNIGNHRYRRLQLQLIAQETLPRQILQLPPVEERAICQWSLALDSLEELAPVPFVLRLPERLVPGFDIFGCALRWVLVVVAEVARGSDAEVRLPVTVAPASPSATMLAQAAPLAVGSERMRLIWTNVAQRSGVEFRDGRLHGRSGEGPRAVEFEVRRGLAPRGGPRLIGELRMASLAIGLSRKPERRSNGLRAREPVLTALLGHELGPLLGEHMVSEADDDHLLFERDEAGLHLDHLEAFVVWLRAVAEVVARLPSVVPAPTRMQAHLPTWETAASAMGGQLRRADMRIELVRDPLRVTIGCVFDDEGEPCGTLLELHAGLAIPSRLQLAWNGHDPLPEHPWPLTELIRAPSWASGTLTLEIGERSVQVILPAPLPDPRFERDRIELMFELGRVLHGEHDPYR